MGGFPGQTVAFLLPTTPSAGWGGELSRLPGKRKHPRNGLKRNPYLNCPSTLACT